MKKLVLLAVLATAAFSACQKSNNPSPINKVPGGISAKSRAVLDTDVYIAGNMRGPGYDFFSNPVDVAGYWKNGVFNAVQAVAGPANASAYTISVSGADVYVGGYDRGGSIKGIPCYWKNGVEVQLPIPAGNTGTVTSMVVNGSDVYAAGYYRTNDANHTNRAAIWKNGVLTTLAFNKESSASTGIALDGTDVYVCGYSSINGVICAIYWKNNVWHPFAGTATPSYASAIAVDANHNYYISGTNSSGACYWKDGNAVTLTGNSYTHNNNPNFIANNIATANGFAYVGGASLCVPCNDDVSTYWKNGQPVQFNDSIDLGGISAIQITGSDIYTLSGDIFSQDQLAFYYAKNGKVIKSLPAGTVVSTGAMAVVVH